MTDQTNPEVIPLTKPRLASVLVEDDGSLGILLSAVNSTDEIALDAERASGFRYGQKAYLIQIAIRGQGIYLLDPTVEYKAELSKQLREFISSKTWIIHAASQDLACLAEYGFIPCKLFDTELAGRILGYPKVSLGTLCETLLNIGLAKEHSAVDWSTRPLPEAWLNYAALDVDVLFELADVISKKLEEAERLEIALAEFDFLTKPVEKVSRNDRWRSTNGIHDLKQVRDLTVLKSLWEKRENLAKEKDVAPGRLVPDLSLIALVKANPKTKSELASLRSFSGRASRTYLDLWWDAYQSGLTSNDLVELRVKATGIPNHRNWANKFPEANIRLQWMKVFLAELSENTKIPVENLLSPELVRAICFEPPIATAEAIKQRLSQGFARSWQIELLAPYLIIAIQKTKLPEQKPEANTAADS